MLVLSPLAKAATDTSLTIQSKLVNSNGTNVTNGSYSFRFLFYTVASSGSNVWSEDQTLTVTDGIVNAELGSVTPFAANLFDNSDLYLQICLNANGTPNDSSNANCGAGTHNYEEVFSTRKKITAVPFARRAARANALIDGSGNAYDYNSFLRKAASDVWNGANAALTMQFKGVTNANLLFVDGTNDRVGIGTGTPQSLLSVGSNSEFRVSSSGNLTRVNDIPYSFPAAQGGASTVLTNDGSGNLTWAAGGGGSSSWSSLTNPSGNLALTMNSNLTTFTWGNSTGANNMFTLLDSASNTGTGALLNVQTAIGSSAMPLRVRAGSAEAIAVESTGEVGIGTTTPAYKLDVRGTIASGNGTYATQELLHANLGNANDPGLYYHTSMYGIPTYDGFVADVPAGNTQGIIWGTRGNGDVALFGGTSDLTKEVQFSLMHNANTTNMTNARQFMFSAKGSGSNYQGVFEWQFGGSGPVAGMIIDPNPSANVINNVIFPNGNVGVGMTSPTGLFKLEVNGSIGPYSSPTAVSGGRTITTVDNAADVGQFSSIRVLPNGRPIIAYYDTTTDDLKVLYCGDASCSAGNVTTVVDSAGDVGQYVSIMIGFDGLPVMSYYDVTNADLKVLKCGDYGCTSGNTITAVDSTGNVGQYTSIAEGRDSFPVVSYYDVTNANLKVAKCGNTSCSSGNTLTAVDSTGTTGLYSSIMISTDGFPIISYHDQTNGDLRVANCGSADCSAGNTLTTVDSATGTQGMYSSMTLTADGLPFIAHHNGTGLDLRRSKCGTTACNSGNTSGNIVTTGSIGQYTSVDRGTSGFPVISTYDTTNGNLVVVKCGNALCSAGNTQTSIDTTGDVGRYTSIAVSKVDGLPVISYYDVTNSSLKVVKCTTADCSQNSVNSGALYTGGSNIGSTEKFFNNMYAVRFWAKEGLQVSNFDLAEDYSVIEEDIVPGELVSLADGEATTVKRTSGAYDPMVIGVVSTKPGIRLTDWDATPEESASMKPIALSGRVPVLVSNENGDIKKGDKLVPATTNGYAMNACGPQFCKAGVSIGVALEDKVWPKSEGEVTVLDGRIEMFINLSQYLPDDIAKTIQNASVIASGITSKEGNLSFDKGFTSTNAVITIAEIGILKSKGITIGENIITLAENGNITTSGEITAKKITVEEIKTNALSVSQKSAGKGTVKKGQASVIIKSDSINSESIVIATLAGTVDTAKMDVRFAVQVRNGELEVSLNQIFDRDIEFYWMKVDVFGESDTSSN